MTAPTPSPTPRPPGPSLRISIVLIVAGSALAIATFIVGIVPIVRAVRSPVRFDVPGSVRTHLDHGEYMVYEDKGAASIGSAFSRDNSVTINPQDVTVTAADGTTVDVSERGSLIESITNEGRRYVGAVRFTAPAAGTYVVHVIDTAQATSLVAKPLGPIARRSIGWFALAGLGGVLFVIGIVLLIVGAVRRGRRQSIPAFAASPPGWHPDPWGSGRWRWWDGAQWTDRVQ